MEQQTLSLDTTDELKDLLLNRPDECPQQLDFSLNTHHDRDQQVEAEIIALAERKWNYLVDLNYHSNKQTPTTSLPAPLLMLGDIRSERTTYPNSPDLRATFYDSTGDGDIPSNSDTPTHDGTLPHIVPADESPTGKKLITVTPANEYGTPLSEPIQIPYDGLLELNANETVKPLVGDTPITRLPAETIGAAVEANDVYRFYTATWDSIDQETGTYLINSTDEPPIPEDTELTTISFIPDRVTELLARINITTLSDAATAELNDVIKQAPKTEADVDMLSAVFTALSKIHTTDDDSRWHLIAPKTHDIYHSPPQNGEVVTPVLRLNRQDKAMQYFTHLKYENGYVTDNITDVVSAGHEAPNLIEAVRYAVTKEINIGTYIQSVYSYG